MADTAIKSPGRGGRKSRAERIAHLERENAELRERLALNKLRTLSAWECSPLPQEARDELAARALIAEWGDPERALVRLGFPSPRERTMSHEDVTTLQRRIFETDGVRAALARNLADVEGHKSDMLRRQVSIVIYGDDEASVRAFTQLAKVAGWNKPDADAKKPITLNLYNLINGTGAIAAQVSTEVPPGTSEYAALDFLSHEPGAAIRIDSGDDAVDVHVTETIEQEDDDGAMVIARAATPVSAFAGLLPPGLE